ncbi:hypothetical protein [Microbacterium sp.]|uniref:hypothetical protein n=1 Tax=Microbacterium sp. TaxID=51671 RepID=UPI0025EFDF6A|nr:hypothetical protein [Microbacterium sp.]MBT9607478.1 hypothetical protein [Microbacterium sp.]
MAENLDPMGGLHVHARSLRPRRVIGGFLVAISLGLLSWGALALSVPIPVPSFSDPPFILATTDSPHNSVWLNVTSSRPFSAESGDEKIELVIDVLGEPGSAIDLALGGTFSADNTTCASYAVDLEPAIAGAEFDMWDPFVRYLQRRPGTGNLFNVTGVNSRSRADAEAMGTGAELLLGESLVLSDTSRRAWQSSASSEVRSYELASARITCSVSRSALVESWLFRDRFRAPDLVASSASTKPEDVVKVEYRLEASSSGALNTSAATFSDTERNVDDDGSIVSSYADDWWVYGREGVSGISLTGGSIIWEPAEFTMARNWARLIAGLLASITVAVSTATVIFWSRDWQWISK